jgi:glycolate oxidase FAD binding subunit
VNDPVIADWQARVRVAAAAKSPLRVVGGGSKDFYGQALDGQRFDTTEYAGIIAYDATELVITARCGTPLGFVEQTLRDAGQMLACEPPHFAGPVSGGPSVATLGGCIAAGLSGPRRAYAASVRDLVLGVRVLDGQGEDLSFGGRVIKNVAGFDVSRLIVGSLGTLGIILEVSLKTLPLPKSETTRVFELSADQAVRKCNEWSARPLPLSATCYYQGRQYVRLSGASSAIAAATRLMGGQEYADGDSFWASVRNHRHPFFAVETADPPSSLWRLSVRSTAPFTDLGGDQMMEWSGALRWVYERPQADAERLRAWAREHGGHATLFRATDKAAGVFQPLAPPALALHQRLKAIFDPAGILNRGRMYAAF